jgi:hypothetical protein
MTLAFDRETIQEIVEEHPEAVRAGPGDAPDCPECGLPMLGANTDGGPF